MKLCACSRAVVGCSAVRYRIRAIVADSHFFAGEDVAQTISIENKRRTLLF